MSIGDTIKCHDDNNMITVAEDLRADGYGVHMDFRQCTVTVLSLPEEKKDGDP